MNSQKELLQSQTGAENQNNSDSSRLIEREAVEGTPLIIVGSEETGWMITLGKYQVSRRYPVKEMAIDAVSNRDYELLLSLMSVILEQNIRMYVEAEAKKVNEWTENTPSEKS
ncbi:MAG: hypothetical protein [Microviridae sp.]|nr:MAG: hypothetical protein [Microviridae sp.]